MTKDRRSQLLNPDNVTLNGVDFVEIASADQTTLRVHFLNSVAVEGTLTAASLGSPNPSITGGESIATVPVLAVQPADWSTDAEGRPLLTLRVAAPGDFSFYTLTILSSALDPFYNHVQFTFKALCDSGLDCEPAAALCPPVAGDLPPIAYLAKDFTSFRRALSDFSALRYPGWQERSEADFGVIFMEALSSIADDLSYSQDRVAAEAAIDTATQLRSLVRLARLVDYEPRPATAASVLLQFEVTTSPVPSGLLVSATAADGSTITFETGTGLVDASSLQLTTTTYPVSQAWNRLRPDGSPNIPPYYFDDSQRCLPAGSTEMWVEGHGFGFTAGQQLLIDTAGQVAGPPVREVVVLSSADEQMDELFLVPITHLVFESPTALQHDLTQTVLAGNLVPATEGRRYSERFAIENSLPGTQTPLAIVRTGPDGTAQYRYTLQNAPLVWLNQGDPAADPVPEVVMSAQAADQELPPVNWNWRGSLLNSEPFEDAFTIDPVSFVKLGENSDSSTSWDYDGDEGATIRFGDGTFGEIPPAGSVFRITYRVGGGSAGNVAADTINRVDPPAAASFTAVTNPFPATGGADRETNQQIARRAPQAFRAVQYRAVRPEDYVAAAESLRWVLRAGTVFRWTGSWRTIFTTADPKNSETVTASEQIELIDLLNRYRMAGYESYAPSPEYVGIDLQVTICACPFAFRADAEAAVIAALSTVRNPDGTSGFFLLDNFTFGTPLERSSLEAAIQAAYGVAGVISIEYRQRGVTAGFTALPETVPVKANEILRMDNDPSRPERGTLQVIVEGGK